MKTDVELIVKFISALMDGECIPTHNSTALKNLSNAVGRVHAEGDPALQTLGLQVLGCLIDRVRSSISAGEVLGHFIRGGHDEY